MPPSIHLLFAIFSLILSLPVGGAELRLTGIPLDKRDKLVAQLSPRLDFIKTREPSPWRADDAAFFLKRLLIRTGHADAEVKWELPGGNVILLKATPGPQYRYGTITANRLGPLSQNELENYFLQAMVETELVGAKDAPYIEDYDEPGAANVSNLLKSLGYWKASVMIIRKTTDRTNKRVNISLDLGTGPRHILADPSFSGASAEEVVVFRNKMAPHIGKIATTEALSKVRVIVENYYREHGYEFANITVLSHHRDGRTRLAFSIERGKLYRVGNIIITGNDSTQRRHIRKYFNALRGKPFNRNDANDSLSKLLSTGAYSRATLTPVPNAAGKLDLNLDLAETQTRSLRSYAGIGSYEGFIIGSSYTDLNFLGHLLRFNARGEYSSRGFLGESSLTEPFFLGEALQLNMRAFLLQHDYEGYSKKEAGGEVALLWSPSTPFSTRLYAGASWVSASSVDLSSMELGPDNYFHTRTGIQQTIDFRDSVTQPTKGFYVSTLLEIGNVAGDASTGYIKGQIDSSYRHPIGEKQMLMSRFSTGFIRPDDTADLPIDLRLFSGGDDSVRSYGSREMGPRSLSDDPLGGQSYWNASLEYVFDVSDPIAGVIFLDAGQVYQDLSVVDFSNPSYAAGVGLRIDLPIGPVRLEYGYNLNRRTGEPRGMLHFTIGTTF